MGALAAPPIISITIGIIQLWRRVVSTCGSNAVKLNISPFYELTSTDAYRPQSACVVRSCLHQFCRSLNISFPRSQHR